jgi:hypothetical protein
VKLEVLALYRRIELAYGRRMPSVSAPVRVDGYLRVSRVGNRRGPRFISPSVQREAIEGWTARQGFELAEVFEELDESGARADRPLLELAIQRVELRATAGLVVWRVDRFGRSLIRWTPTCRASPSRRRNVLQRARRA